MSEHENATPRPWEAQTFNDEYPGDGVAIIGLRKEDGKTLCTPTNGLVAIATLLPSEFDRKDAKRAEANAALIVEAVNAYDTLRAENERLRAALKAILSAETHLLHCGYDDGPGGGNYVYKDVIRTDDEAFALARAALSEAQP